ncbi:Uncharacterised protein [Mycobacterium tuberculosis]|nr:Uncharacterised protein [Mycobacterium tuberculosis]
MARLRVSSDPKPREGTETRGTVPPGPAPSGSSDPKPREGTETRKRSTSLTILFSRRQTQNPERGRKRPVDGGCVVRASVVRPKTPRGDGNILSANSSTVPLSGRQTQNPERGRKLVRHLCLIQVQCPVVRPKTPRGDGNPTMASKSAWVTDPGRQTQNPERGRKLDAESHRVREVQQSSDPKPREGTETRNPAPHPQLRHAPEVVRPKTPRGDGNAYRPPHHSHATAPCPQTQNPERGRKHTADDSYVRVTSSQSSDPKPREGTET